jgi:hypothetical protein
MFSLNLIFRDGLPSDDHGTSGQHEKQAFVEALRGLQGLPVWVVIRLCTDDERVVDFYNNLDKEVELRMEVLDDFLGEGSEVHEHNPWVNYALPLHRMREFGYHHPLFDLLDERPFTKDEIRMFCELLFGAAAMDGVPDAAADWKGFVACLVKLLDKESKQWNPVSKRVEPWINIRTLKRIHGGGGWLFG